MTSKEFEVMRNAQKAESKLEVLRALDDVRAEIVVYYGDCSMSLSENDERCKKCTDTTFNSILNIIQKKMREYE